MSRYVTYIFMIHFRVSKIRSWISECAADNSVFSKSFMKVSDWLRLNWLVCRAVVKVTEVLGAERGQC